MAFNFGPFLLLFSCWVMSESVTPWTQHTRFPYPRLPPRVCSNSCPSSWWCYSTISSSAASFSLCLQSFPASGSFPVSQLFTSGGQSIGASASASVLSMNIQGWFPFALTGWISLQSKGLSRVFSSTQPSLWSSCHICTWLLEKPCVKVTQQCLTLCNPMVCPWNSPGKNTEVDRHSPLQVSNLGLLHCRQIIYHLIYHGIYSFDYKNLYQQSDVSAFNTLSRFVKAFLPRSKCLLISWLWPPSTVILEPKKIKSVTASTSSPSVCHEVVEPDAIILAFGMLSFKPAWCLNALATGFSNWSVYVP